MDIKARSSAARRRTGLISLAVLAMVASLTNWAVGPVQPAGAAVMNVAVVKLADGTAPFRDQGTLGAHDPGDDISANNGIVRTQDTVTFRVDYSLNEPDDSNPILTMNLPPDVAFTGGYTPPIGQGGCDGPIGYEFNADRTQLICDLGVFPTGADSETIAIVVSVTPSANFPNGSSFQLSASLEDGAGTPSNGISPPVQVSSAPNFNLFKRNDFSGAGANVGNASFTAPPVADQQGGVDGFRANLLVGLNGSGGDERGLAPLAEPVLLRDHVDIPGAPAGVNGIRLLQCTTGNGTNDRWPTNVPAANPLTIPDRQLHASTVACSQPGGDGTPIDISFSNIDWARTAPAPTRSGSGAGAAAVDGLITYALLQVWISYEDWVDIGHALGTVEPFQAINQPAQEVGSVAFADRLHGPAGTTPAIGSCNTGAGWIAPADVDGADPSTWDPSSPSGASNLGAAVESATDNGACFRRTITPLPDDIPATGGPSSVDGDWQKFSPTGSPNYRVGPAVTAESTIDNAMRLLLSATYRNPDDVRNQPANFGWGVGSMMCDNWDNSRFGPDPALGEEWIEPEHIADPESDFTAYYAEGTGWHYEYGRGDWGTHNPDRANAYYKQGRSACDDVPNTASGPSDRPSYLLPLQDGGSVYWATEDQVDFTNSGNGLIDIDDVNSIRVVLDVPMYPLLPSRLAEYTEAQIDAVTTANVIQTSTDFRLTMHWKNRPGLEAPIEMRNYSNRRVGPVGGNLTWASPRAVGFNDAAQTATVDPPCGAPCGQNANVGNEFFALWWQIAGPDVGVSKARIGTSPIAPGATTTWRLRAGGRGPAGTPDGAEGTTPNVTIDDVLPVGLTYVPGSVVSAGAVAVGEPTVLADTPAAGQTTLRWFVPAMPWTVGSPAISPWDIQFQTQTSPFLSNETYTNVMQATGTSFEGNRGASAQVATSQAAAIGVLNKSVSPQLLSRGDTFEYSLDYGNPGTLPFDTFDAIDILPWNQDQAHERRSEFDDGAIELLDVLPSTKNEVAWVSTVAPAVLDAADSGTADDTDGFLDPADAAALGSAQWPCTWADTEAGAPGCPAIADVTALRFVGSGTPFLASNTGPFTITLQYRATDIADPGDVYDNSWVARFGDLTFPVYRPIPVPPQVIAPPFALGNQVWIDSNGNGLRDVGEPPVAGATVNLLNAAGDTVLDTTTTDASGLYVFDELDAGTYVVEIDAANFGPGGVLAGLASSPGQANTDGADNNDNGAPAPGGSVRSTTVTLGGDDYEPIGEDPTSTAVALDEYADLTIDFGFVRGIRIGNLVWSDLDDDGVAEPGEPGIVGVDVQLVRDDGDGVFEPGIDVVVATTTTVAGGAYWFLNVESGSYFVAIPGGQAELAGTRSSTGSTGGLATDSRDDGAPVGTYASVTGLLAIDATVDQPTGEAGADGVVNDEDEANAATSPSGDTRSNLTFDFGFFEQYAVGNQVWRDANDNGVRDASEQPIANVTVNLLSADGSTVLRTTTTDTNGLYVFDGLPAGTYIVEIPSSNFATGAPLRGWRSSTGSTPTDGSDSTDNGEPVTDPGATPTPTVAVRSVPVVLGDGPEPVGEAPTSVTQAADDHADLTVDFGFRPEPATACRGLGFALGSLMLAVANTPIRACVSIDPAFPSGLNFGSIPLPNVLGGLLGKLVKPQTIGFNADGFHGVSYRYIDGAAADSDAVRAQISLPGIQLGFNTIRSDSSAFLGAGCTRIFGGASRIGSLSLNGLPIVGPTSAPLTLPLGIATLYLNQKVIVGDTIIHRAVYLDVAGSTAADIVIGESQAGISCTP